MEQEKGIESEGVILSNYVAAAVKLFIRGVGELHLTDLSFYLLKRQSAGLRGEPELQGNAA